MRGATSDALAILAPLLAELNNLKRIRRADSPGSLAEETFRRSWCSLVGGEAPERVVRRETARALAAARLGGIDLRVLTRAGLTKSEATGILEKSFDAVAGPLDGDLSEELRRYLSGEPDPEGGPPEFVGALARQPRAGATHPGRPRIMVESPESHADHCATVAVYGALLSARFGADPTEPFLAGLAHHLHNAALPDAGFAGEELLGDRLEPVMARLTEEALEQLPAGLSDRVGSALELVGVSETPEARAFNAADVVDRVLQMRHHARAAAFTLDQALDEMELVHEGPLKDFHEEVLRETGLRSRPFERPRPDIFAGIGLDGRPPPQP